jgi:hypothetical protein
MSVEKSAIGRAREPVTIHVEREKIQKFARAPGRWPTGPGADDGAGRDLAG